MGHRPRNRDLPAIFQPNRKAPRQIAIGNRGAGPGDPRRLRQAARASCFLGRLKWHAATAAASFAEELDLLPAVGAKAVHVVDDRATPRATRRQRKIERRSRAGPNDFPEADHIFLSLRAAHRTSAAVPDLFDMRLRALRRDRAARMGRELFLYERTFEDCLERIALIDRRFTRALLIGCPDPSWPERLGALADKVEAHDPGSLFAAAAQGHLIIEDAWHPEAGGFDLVLAIGTLDTVNDLPLALRLIRHSMSDNGVLMGALSGGDTLPRLRTAMRAADAVSGDAAPHVHPRIDASALSPLLTNAGFLRCVVDVERVAVAYSSLDRLVNDLRAMGATNVLGIRPRPLTRAQAQAAAKTFAGGQDRVTETFEILHFAAWTPAKG